MKFTQIPEDMAPVGGQLIYGFSEWDTDAPFDVKIYDADADALVSVKRFAGVRAGEIDAAPTVRRLIRFRPTAGGSGILPSVGRTVCVEVDTGGLSSGQRRFTACSETPSVPSLICRMPTHRVISLHDTDELTLCVSGQFSVLVKAEKGNVADSRRYTGSADGPSLVLFNLDASDMNPDTERITVEAECGGETFCRVEYVVAPRRAGSVRLAWRSSEGSIEHYTFPVVKSGSLCVDREKFLMSDGYRDAAVSSYVERTLRSAYESGSVAEALAEVVASSDVWIVGRSGYVPVDIPSQQSILKRNGGLQYVELVVRSEFKEHLL